MDDFETFLILKFGSLSRAYHLWINTRHENMNISEEEYDRINHFFAEKSLRERLAMHSRR